MTGHVLVVSLDADTEKQLDAGYCALPELVEDHRYDIECTDPTSCQGWQECSREHICKHGHGMVFDELSTDGPCPGLDNANCQDTEEEQFHGQWHTYRWGWGWTTRFPGCVVSESALGWGGLPDGHEALPVGRYVVDDDWQDETECYLTLVSTEPLGTMAASA